MTSASPADKGQFAYGKHDIYRHTESAETIRLPRHQTVSIGIAQQIAKQAGWEQ